MANKTPLKNKANKTPLKNKAIQDILEDAQDGVLKDETIDKVKEVLKEWNPKEDKGCAPGMYAYNGACYQNLRAIPVPLSQARVWFSQGKITQVK